MVRISALSLLLAAPAAWAARVQVHQFDLLQGEVGGKPLCAPDIVEETCMILSGGTTDASMEDLQKMLSADDKSILAAWTFMGLPMGQRVPCTQLCAAVVKVLGDHWTVPPFSDVACYTDENGKVKCDIDLSPEAIGGFTKPGRELPDFHDKVPLPKDGMKSKEAPGPRVLVHSKVVDYTTHDIIVRQANLFHIFPTPATDFVQEEHPSQSFLEDLQRQNMSYGKCDATFCPSLGAQACEFKYSCGGCPQCAGKSEEPDVQNGYASSCSSFCKSISDPCTLRMSCGDCPECKGSGSATVTKTRTTTTTPSAGSWKVGVAKRNVQAQAYVNQAIVKLKSRAADKTSLKWFGPQATDAHFQTEMLRVLNSVANMMGNVEYVFPGPQCSPNTFAYVYPRGRLSKDQNGKFVFYLCQLYMDSEESVQIETLTHEGSHHATSYTDDVCMDEFYGGKKPTYVEEPKSTFGMSVEVDDTVDYRPKTGGSRVPAVVRFIKGDVVVLQLEPERDCEYKAYGRQPCMDLAKKDAIKALRNADNVCYWIQDITDAA